jgi:hypothetical protein
MVSKKWSSEEHYSHATELGLTFFSYSGTVSRSDVRFLRDLAHFSTERRSSSDG